MAMLNQQLCSCTDSLTFHFWHLLCSSVVQKVVGMERYVLCQAQQGWLMPTERNTQIERHRKQGNSATKCRQEFPNCCSKINTQWIHKTRKTFFLQAKLDSQQQTGWTRQSLFFIDIQHLSKAHWRSRKSHCPVSMARLCKSLFNYCQPLA